MRKNKYIPSCFALIIKADGKRDFRDEYYFLTSSLFDAYLQSLMRIEMPGDGVLFGIIKSKRRYNPKGGIPNIIDIPP